MNLTLAVLYFNLDSLVIKNPYLHFLYTVPATDIISLIMLLSHRFSQRYLVREYYSRIDSRKYISCENALLAQRSRALLNRRNINVEG